MAGNHNSGRKPDPIPIKILKGRNAGHQSNGKPIPVAPAFADRSAPDPPAFLAPVARDLWDRIAPSLERLDLLKPEDYTAFATYCETWATYVEALELVRSGGLVIHNPNTGMPHRNPALVTLETAGLQALRFATEFGLTPVAEVRLARPARDVDDGDPFAGGQATGT